MPYIKPKMKTKSVKGNIICKNCKSSLDNIGTYCPYCGYDCGGEAQCLSCGENISQIEYWSNHNKCPSCKDDPYHRIIASRNRDLTGRFNFISKIKYIHEIILDSINTSTPNPIYNWKLGFLILTLLTIISIPLVVILIIVVISVDSGLLSLIIITLIGQMISKEYPNLIELFKLKDVGLALIKKNIRVYNNELDIPPDSVIILRNFEVDSMKSYENWLNRTYDFFKGIGLVFAFGKPGEVFQPSKATKFYIKAEDNWYGILKKAIKKVKLILIIHDCSDGLVWEFKQCVLANDPKKVVIFIPPNIGFRSYLKTNKILNEKVGHILPQKIPVFHEIKKNKIGFIAFDEMWNPFLVKPTSIYLFLYKYSKKILMTDVYLFLFASYLKPILKRVDSRFTLTMNIKLLSEFFWRVLILLFYGIIIFQMIKSLVLNVIDIFI
jgi:hypothetical protein